MERTNEIWKDGDMHADLRCAARQQRKAKQRASWERQRQVRFYSHTPAECDTHTYSLKPTRARADTHTHAHRHVHTHSQTHTRTLTDTHTQAHKHTYPLTPIHPYPLIHSHLPAHYCSQSVPHIHNNVDATIQTIANAVAMIADLQSAALQ